MIFSENRYPLFRIMLEAATTAVFTGRNGLAKVAPKRRCVGAQRQATRPEQNEGNREDSNVAQNHVT
jgi:hypothetical protein